MQNPYQVASTKILDVRQENDVIKIFKLKLDKPLKFQAGQFFLVSYPGFGEGPLAPCSSPDKPDEIEFCIRQVGTLTEKLHQLKKGDKIGIRGPYGKGWPPLQGQGTNLLLVAGGMGLVPLRPVILQYLTGKKVETSRACPVPRHGDLSLQEIKFIPERIPERIQVFYGAKKPADLIFKSDFDAWQKAGIDLEVTVEQKLPNWFGHVGTITTLFDDVKVIKNAKCFMVGPPVMYQFILPKLQEAGFADKDIFVSLERRMQCGLGVCQHCAVGPYYVCHQGPVFCWKDLKDLDEVYQMM